MGLRDTIQNVATSAVSAIGDLATDCDYVSVSDRNYDATTGTETYTELYYPDVKVTFFDFSEMEIDGDRIKRQDKKGLLAAKGLAFTPKDNDRVRRDSDEDMWEVVGWTIDPADALYILHLRKM